jgi:hypothetical protein
LSSFRKKIILSLRNEPIPEIGANGMKLARLSSSQLFFEMPKFKARRLIAKSLGRYEQRAFSPTPSGRQADEQREGLTDLSKQR